MDEWWSEFGWGEAGPHAGRSGRDRPRFDWVGADRDKRQPKHGGTDRPRAPRVPDYGMTAEGLAEYQDLFCQYARKRIKGVGKDQYDLGDMQKFENMTVSSLISGLREELADIINYAVMLDIQASRWLTNFIDTSDHLLDERDSQ